MKNEKVTLNDFKNYCIQLGIKSTYFEDNLSSFICRALDNNIPLEDMTVKFTQVTPYVNKQHPKESYWELRLSRKDVYNEDITHGFFKEFTLSDTIGIPQDWLDYTNAGLHLIKVIAERTEKQSKQGHSGPAVLEQIRELLIKGGIKPLQASNIVKLGAEFANLTNNGTRQYSREELRAIIDNAFFPKKKDNE